MTIEKEILVYQNIPHTKYRWVLYISYLQAAFLIGNFWMMPSKKFIAARDKASLERLKSKNSEKTESSESNDENGAVIPGYLAEETVSYFDLFKGLKFSELFSLKNLEDNLNDKPYQAAGFTMASIAMMTSFWIFASRAVHKIFLLPGDKARFIFFSPLPIKQGPVMELDLKNIACIAPRNSPNTFSILKFRNTLGYRLVDRKEGQFLKPKLYDEYLGFQRSWYKN